MGKNYKAEPVEYGVFNIPKTDPTVKPEQWGPLREVQSSIFRAGDLHGVDTTKLAFACPFWSELARNKNYITGVTNVIADGTPYGIKDGITINGYITQSSDRIYWNDGLYMQTPAGDPKGTIILQTRIKITNGGIVFNVGGITTSNYSLTASISGTNVNFSPYYGNGSSPYGMGTHTHTNGLGKISHVGIYYPGDYKSGQVYIQGRFVASPSTGNVGSTTTKKLEFGYGSPLYAADTDIISCLVWNEYRVPKTVHELLYEQPYLLFQRTPAPTFVDLGANTGRQSALVPFPATTNIITSKTKQQKPEQWGPLREVKQSVYRNAELLGMDLKLLVGVFPFWEGAGTNIHNVVGGSNTDGAIFGTGPWQKDGFGDIAAYGAAYAKSLPNQFDGTTTFSALIQTYLQASITVESALIRSENNFAIEIMNSTTGTTRNLLSTNGGTTGWTTANDYVWGAFPVKTSFQIGFRWGSGILNHIYNGRFGNNSTVTGTLNSAQVIDTYRYWLKLSSGGGTIITATIQSALFYKGWLGNKTIELLKEQPYFLIQHNPAPVIVDLGANTGLEKGFQLI
jgi:hypothetical protein